MRLLVTGSSGQIGSYLVDAARAAGHQVVGVDRRGSKWTSLKGDLRVAKVCQKAVRGCDAAIHLAAHVSVPESVEDPVEDAKDNVLAAVQLVDAARRAHLKRLVSVSSAAVYGTPQRLPINEEHPTIPLSPYGASKLAGELYATLARGLWSLPTIVVRPFNVYSPRQDPKSPYSGVLSRFAARVKAGKPPIIFGDGSQTRDFVHAEDVAAWLLRLADPALDISKTPVVNLGTGIETRIDALARGFTAAAGLRREPEFGDPRPGEIQRSVADTSRQFALGLRPKRSIDGEIRDLLA